MTKHVKMAIPTSHCAGLFLPWILKQCLHLIDEFVSRGYRRRGLKKDDLSPPMPDMPAYSDRRSRHSSTASATGSSVWRWPEAGAATVEGAQPQDAQRQGSRPGLRRRPSNAASLPVTGGPAPPEAHALQRQAGHRFRQA